MPVTETNIGQTWMAAQTAKGTPATVATRSFKHVAGGVATNIETGNENYLTMTKWGGRSYWFNSMVGQGTPGLEGTPAELAWLLWAMHGGNSSVSPAGTNEVQTATISGAPTGGSFVLSLDGRPTTALAYNAAAATVQTALEALPNIGTGNVTVTGGAGGPYTITFVGAMQKRPVPNLVATHSFTGGTSPTIAVAKTTPGVNALHTFTPVETFGHWITLWQRLGIGDIWRQKYNDGQIGGLTIEASSGTKALRATPNLLFLDPAEVFATDPTVPLPTTSPMLYTEGAGTFEVDDIALRGQSQLQIQLNENLSPIYGDDVIPYEMVRGTATAVVTLTVIADTAMHQRWNQWVYNNPSPPAGTKPIKRIPPLGSYSCDLQKKDSAGSTIGSFKADIPGIQWTVPDAVAPNPDQGSAEISLTGSLEPIGTLPLYTFTVGCQSAQFVG